MDMNLNMTLKAATIQQLTFEYSSMNQSRHGGIAAYKVVIKKDMYLFMRGNP